MFRASPWISYDPSQQLPFQQSRPTTDDDSVRDPHHDPADEPERHGDMDAPEISTLREEEEETPPPDAGRLSFSKFRVNLRMPARGQSSASSGSAVAPPTGPPSTHRMASSPPESDDEDEEDQLIDDDEVAVVPDTGRLPVSSPPSLPVLDSPASTPTPRKRGSATRGRQRRGGVTGRRGRPGREPPDAAAMMSTFELNKTDQVEPNSGRAVSPPSTASAAAPAPQTASPSTADWSSSAPPKPPRKKPGPKKGSTLGPRGPRKNAAKNSQLTSARGTPALDDSLMASDPSAFLIPAPPSIPPTPGSDQPPLPSQQLPPITAPDFAHDPTIPVPVYPLPSRTFPVQAPPKIPTGYATAHPLDPRSGPPRKWKLAQREIKGIAGGRWFARSWVGEKDKVSTGPSALRNTAPPSRSPPGSSANPAQDPEPSLRPTQADSGPSQAPAESGDANAMRSSDVSRPPRHQDTSPEPESPRSAAVTNGTPELGEGPRIPP